MSSKEEKKTKFRLYSPDSILANDKGIVKFPIIKVRQSKKGTVILFVEAYSLQAVYEISRDFTSCRWLGYHGDIDRLKKTDKPDKQQFVEFATFNKKNPCLLLEQ